MNDRSELDFRNSSPPMALRAASRATCRPAASPIIPPNGRFSSSFCPAIWPIRAPAWPLAETFRDSVTQPDVTPSEVNGDM